MNWRTVDDGVFILMTVKLSHILLNLTAREATGFLFNRHLTIQGGSGDDRRKKLARPGRVPPNRLSAIYDLAIQFPPIE